jgi:predicted DNA-binding transcriptional regulator YafY
MFEASEALALVMAVLDGHHEAADPADPAGSALGKIIRALPQPVAEQAEAVRRATAPAPDRGAARPNPQTTTALVQASIDRSRVRIGYRTEAGREWSQEVDPWAVVVRHGRWYLLCWSHVASAPRAFRIDRVSAVDVLDERFEPPPDLDAVAALETHLATGWEYATEVTVDAPLENVTRWLPRGLGRLEEGPEGTTRLVGSTSNPAWYAEQLAVLPVAFHIVNGPELRSAAGKLAERMAESVR